MRRSALLRFGLAPAAVALVAACGAEPPAPGANLERPAGLVYLPRTAENGEERADVLVVDSEAQGVRVQQLLRTADGADLAAFVRAPVVFFPLTIAAPGFPTRVSASLDEARARAYVVAATAVSMTAPGGAAMETLGLLHVLDVRQAPFEASSTFPSNVPIGQLPLSPLVGPARLPVDVAVLFTRDAEVSEDVVALTFDDLEGGPGVLAVLTVRVDGEGVEVSAVETATVAPGPRALLRRADGSLLVSSAASAEVSQFTIAAEAPHLGPRRVLDAGGPTGELIDVPDRYVVGLRVDRSAAVIFEGEPLERSERVFESPFTPVWERVGTPTVAQAGELAVGRIDLGAVPTAVGAAGNITRLVDPSGPGGGTVLVDAPAGEDVVMLVQSDGRAVFLVGEPPRLAVAEPSQVASVVRLDGAEDLQVEGCVQPLPACAPAAGQAAPCAGIAVPPSADSFQARAVYRGRLAWSRSAALALADTATAAPEGTFTLQIPGIALEARLVRPGDQVLVQLLGPGECPAPDETPPLVPLADTGTVEAVEGDVLRVRFAGALGGLAQCWAEVEAATQPRVAVVDVFPGGEEAVLSQVEGEVIQQVLARVPVTLEPGGAARVEFGANGEDGQPRPIAFAMASPSGFRCALAADAGALCDVSADCGPGRACPAPPQVGTEVCPRRCPTACELGAGAACLDLELTRVCPGVELVVAGTRVARFDVRRDTAVAQQAVVRAFAPADAVFLELRRSWLISFPGSRSLVELRPTTNNFSVIQTR